MKTLLLASAALVVTASASFAFDRNLVPSATPTAPAFNSVPSIPAPAAPTPSPTTVMPIPMPNGGVTIGGQHGDVGGVFQHQPHGGGYTTNGVTFGNGDFNGGASVTTGPNNAPVAGGVSVGGSF